MKRLAYVDWMRGLACVLMFETHCYDSWLNEDAKKSDGFRYSQMGGTLPAPLFIFLAGVAVALVTEKLRGKGVERGAIAKQVIVAIFFRRLLPSTATLSVCVRFNSITAFLN